MKMNYEEAKIYRDKLEEKNNADSVNLKTFDKFGKTNIGLTPDHVKEMPEWKLAKSTFEKSFAELRNFNGWFVKTFKKEIQADRRKKWAVK
jgi:hypothetical protein